MSEKIDEFVSILKRLEEFLKKLREEYDLTDYKFILRYKDQDQVTLYGKKK